MLQADYIIKGDHMCAAAIENAHGDGVRRKTDKSDIYNYAISSSQPSSLQINVSDEERVYVLDMVAMLRSLVKVPDTFEALAVKIIEDIPSCYNLIYITCDTYRDISLKSLERKSRGSSPNFLIRSAQVRIPADFQSFLCNGDNKERLFCLIESTWTEKRYLLGNRVIYFARSESCLKISNEGTEVITELKTNHEEVDTRISYLVQHAIQNNIRISEICVRSPSGDIDILVILIGSYGSVDQYIVVDNGTG